MIRRLPHRSAILFCLLLSATSLACCGRSEVDSAWHGEIQPIDGGRVARTLGGSVWGASLALEKETSIGLEDGPDEYVFGRIVALAAHQGRIVVVNQRPIVARVFDYGGRYLFDLGRHGSGPGEYLGPTGVAIREADGVVLLRDSALDMLNLYDRSGTYLDNWRLGSGYASFHPLISTREGKVYTVDRLPRRTGVAEITLAMVDVSNRAARGDTLVVPGCGREPWIIEWDTPEGPLAMSVPFSPELVWAMGQTGSMMSGMSDRYLIEVRRADGGRLLIERVCEPTPFEPGEREWYRDRLTAVVQASAPGWRWHGPEIPLVKPYFTALASDGEGRVWVIRPGPGVRLAGGEPSPESYQGFTRAPLWAQSYLADLFDPDGRFLGDVELPKGLQIDPPPVVTVDGLVAVVQAEEGHLTVRRYRLVGHGAGGT